MLDAAPGLVVFSRGSARVITSYFKMVVIPGNAENITFSVTGGTGGDSGGTGGGLSENIQGTLTLLGGADVELELIAGAGGLGRGAFFIDSASSQAQGYGSGGYPGLRSYNSQWWADGGGGGGGSAILLNGTPLVVSGGGGGGSNATSNQSGTATSSNGGAAGVEGALANFNSGGGNGWVLGGKPGTQSAAGAGGTLGNYGGTVRYFAGTAGSGRNGGAGTNREPALGMGSGGGGGGYWGGGGGGSASTFASGSDLYNNGTGAGGGGGSSYVASTVGAVSVLETSRSAAGGSVANLRTSGYPGNPALAGKGGTVLITWDVPC